MYHITEDELDDILRTAEEGEPPLLGKTRALVTTLRAAWAERDEARADLERANLDHAGLYRTLEIHATESRDMTAERDEARRDYRVLKIEATEEIHALREALSDALALMPASEQADHHQTLAVWRALLKEE